MNDQLLTRCPGCGTVFRVSPAQLALREGQVRCGHCRAVFDANDQRVAVGAPPPDDFEPPDELAAGRPTVTLRNADALQPVRAAESEESPPLEAKAALPKAEPAPPSLETEAAPASPKAGPTPPSPEAEAPSPARTPSHVATASSDAPTSGASVDAPARIDEVALRADRFEWKPRKPLHERPRALYGFALAALVLALGVQAVAEYRDALAAHAPLTRPVLEGTCALFGCTVGPLRDAAAISIDASDLQSDPLHRGLLKLSATIRNRAAYRIAWPDLELTLTDASDRVVVRRAFAPGEYVGAGTEVARGIPGNGENVITLFLDASETSQAGYRLYLFYP